jgi:hypothetical protein
MGAPTLSLDPIIWPDDDDYQDPNVFKAAERYWWHATIAAELVRLRDHCTRPGSTERGISAAPLALLADNIKMNVYDFARYCRQMITWGELVKAAPLWDHSPETWVALATESSPSVSDTP